jgi:hypothetical protein
VAENRRLFALHLLGFVRLSLAAQKFVDDHSADDQKKPEVMEAEWKRAEAELAPALDGSWRPSFDSFPAAVRAVAEIARSEIRVYYDASAEYGRNTVPGAGLYYIGAAFAQRDFVRLLETLRDSPEGKLLTPANLAQEIDRLENELLLAYKLPASIDQHPLFIRGNAMVKHARELQTEGMQIGALYRLLHGRLRFTGSMSTGVSVDSTEAAKRAQATEQRLAVIPGDHSLARLYLEMALAEAGAGDQAGGETARAVFDFVLPAYFAPLQPAAASPALPAPEVTVTLVRWPYT